METIAGQEIQVTITVEVEDIHVDSVEVTGGHPTFRDVLEYPVAVIEQESVLGVASIAEVDVGENDVEIAIAVYVTQIDLPGLVVPFGQPYRRLIGKRALPLVDLGDRLVEVLEDRRDPTQARRELLVETMNSPPTATARAALAGRVCKWLC